jgi:hypothetical protein
VSPEIAPLEKSKKLAAPGRIPGAAWRPPHSGRSAQKNGGNCCFRAENPLQFQAQFDKLIWLKKRRRQVAAAAFAKSESKKGEKSK